MKKKKREMQEQVNHEMQKELEFLNANAKNIKDLIAPAGLDVSQLNHIEIVLS